MVRRRCSGVLAYNELYEPPSLITGLSTTAQNCVKPGKPFALRRWLSRHVWYDAAPRRLAPPTRKHPDVLLLSLAAASWPPDLAGTGHNAALYSARAQPGAGGGRMDPRLWATDHSTQCRGPPKETRFAKLLQGPIQAAPRSLTSYLLLKAAGAWGTGAGLGPG